MGSVRRQSAVVLSSGVAFTPATTSNFSPSPVDERCLATCLPRDAEQEVPPSTCTTEGSGSETCRPWAIAAEVPQNTHAGCNAAAARITCNDLALGERDLQWSALAYTRGNGSVTVPANARRSRSCLVRSLFTQRHMPRDSAAANASSTSSCTERQYPLLTLAPSGNFLVSYLYQVRRRLVLTTV